MHTPDGFLTNWVCVVMLLLSLLPIMLALNNLRKSMDRSKATAIATVAAIIFLAQMINFPIASGTSGHLIGAAFALFILGADGAVIAISSALLIQAIVFGDGGFFALGANIFNMAIVGVYAAEFASRKLNLGRTMQVVVASWFSVLSASLSCSILLAISGTAPIFAVLPAMAITHAVIGICEGLLTLLLLNALANRTQSLSLRSGLALSGISFLFLAILLPFASQSPDALDSVAINFGFYSEAIEAYDAPIADYSVPLLQATPYLAGLAAAFIGTAGVFLMAYLPLSLVWARPARTA